MIASAALTILFNNGVKWFSMAILVISLLALIRYKIDAVYIIPVAGLIGILIL
jgi:hypothetical protein